MARKRAKRAPQRVFQRMNITLQPAPKFATMPGSHAVPQGGMGPSRHARFTQELSFGHWKPVRSSLPEGAIGTRAPPQQAQSEPPTAGGSHASRSGASHAVQGSLDLFEIVTLDADLSVPAPVSMGQRGAGASSVPGVDFGQNGPGSPPSAPCCLVTTIEVAAAHGGWKGRRLTLCHEPLRLVSRASRKPRRSAPGLRRGGHPSTPPKKDHAWRIDRTR